MAAFALQPLLAYPQAPRLDALAAFIADVPRGPAARLTHILMHRTFRECTEAEIVRYRFRCPPCLHAWARRHRVSLSAAQLFAVTGVDADSGDACTLYVPHMPAMTRVAPTPAAAAAAAAVPRAVSDAAAASAPTMQRDMAAALAQVAEQQHAADAAEHAAAAATQQAVPVAAG